MIDTLLASFSGLGALEDTIVVVTSDHGEAFGERGFEGHARKVYRETTEVPWLISFPFRFEPGLVVSSRTSNVDVWPTLFDLLGIEGPDVDGRSRLPEILAAARGEAFEEADDEIGVAQLDQHWARPDEAPEQTIAISQGPLRYVRIEQPTGRIEQLFDAADDPREIRDRAPERAEDLARLAEIAEEVLTREPVWGASPTREIGELELNHLRALGYALP